MRTNAFLLAACVSGWACATTPVSGLPLPDADVAALANEVAAGFALPAIAFTAWDPSADPGSRIPAAVITILDAVLDAIRPANG
jgi:hypothetical protein